MSDQKITNILNQAIADEYDQIVVIGLKKEEMRLQSMNIQNIKLLGLLEIAKYHVLSRSEED